MKRKLLKGGLISACLLLPLTAIYYWFVGWSDGYSAHGQITRLEYYESPPLVAVHFGEPDQVLVISGIDGTNHKDFAQWFDPKNVEIESISVSASSRYNRWSNAIERGDILQFGVHGDPLGKTKPNFGEKVAIGGIARDEFPYQSFTLMKPEEFSRMAKGTLINDVKVWGRLNFSSITYTSWREKPFIIP